MKSGLEGRNNIMQRLYKDAEDFVSMKSGLEGRNNVAWNGLTKDSQSPVSMKSGLEGRNNPRGHARCRSSTTSLNEVRPRRPEQSVQPA